MCSLFPFYIPFFYLVCIDIYSLGISKFKKLSFYVPCVQLSLYSYDFNFLLFMHCGLD
jgi:hypothetical protein